MPDSYSWGVRVLIVVGASAVAGVLTYGILSFLKMPPWRATIITVVVVFVLLLVRYFVR